MRTTRLLGLLLAALIPLAALPGCTAVDEATLADLMSSARRDAGVAPLTVDERASDLARDWSARMAGESKLRHNPNLAGDISNRVGGGWRSYGENIATGRDIYEVNHRFMHSSTHRANVLNRSYERVGVGVAESGGRLWVTVVFIGY